MRGHPIPPLNNNTKPPWIKATIPTNFVLFSSFVFISHGSKNPFLSCSPTIASRFRGSMVAFLPVPRILTTCSGLSLAASLGDRLVIRSLLNPLNLIFPVVLPRDIYYVMFTRIVCHGFLTSIKIMNDINLFKKLPLIILAHKKD